MTTTTTLGHERRQRQGFIALCVAENKLVLDLLAERLSGWQQPATAAAFADSRVYTYNSMLGMPVAREAAAYFLARHFLYGGKHGNHHKASKKPNKKGLERDDDTTDQSTKKESSLLRTTTGGNLSAAASNSAVDEEPHNPDETNDDDKDDDWVLTPEQALQEIPPKCIGLGAGCAALINHVFFLLGEPGDVCLIPQPYYAAFENDINLMAQIQPRGIPQAQPWLGPTLDELDQAYETATRELQAQNDSKNNVVKFLLLTNPNNPLGTIYPPHVLRRTIAWARQHQLHIVVDEIYALSTHYSMDDKDQDENEEEEDTRDDPLSSSTSSTAIQSSSMTTTFSSLSSWKQTKRFQSVIALLDNDLGTDVHVLWAVSKDFGASGLRCGLLYTHNLVLMEGLATLSIFTCVSGPIQVSQAVVKCVL